ncbi:hypothetical protein GCM10027446_25490 [Angustibacter peucedani]
MRPPRTVLRPSAAVVLALAVLGGCSQVEDSAKGAASSAASKATDQAKTQAREAAVDQVCGLTEGSGPLSDGAVSANEKAVIASIASAAEQAGVPSTYTGPLQTIASDGGAAATKAASDQLKSACADR